MKSLFFWIVDLAGIALMGALLYYSAIVPNARRAERLERRSYALEDDVTKAAADVERLRREVTALESDPYTIERTLKRRLRELRPDLFGPDGEPVAPPVVEKKKEKRK